MKIVVQYCLALPKTTLWVEKRVDVLGVKRQIINLLLMYLFFLASVQVQVRGSGPQTQAQHSTLTQRREKLSQTHST